MEISLSPDAQARLAQLAVSKGRTPEVLAEEVLSSRLIDNPEPLQRERADFAASEQYYLLQYIYYGDLRITALLIGLIAGLTLYFTRFAVDASHFLHRVLEVGVFASGVLAFLMLGIALCPIPEETPRLAKLREKLRFLALGRRVPDRARFSHYLDVHRLGQAGSYLSEFDRLDRGEIVQERLRHCLELGRIAKERMDLIIAGTLLSGVTMLLILVDVFLKGMAIYE